MKATDLIVLAAHGAGDDSRANERVRALADSLRGQVSAPVLVGFNQGTPRLDALDEFIDGSTNVKSTIVLPLLLSDGYMANRVVPRLLAGNDRLGQLELRPVLGSVPRLAEVLLAQVEEAVDRTGRRSVVIVGHGTTRDVRSGMSVERIADALRERDPALDVQTAFLDQPPFLDDMTVTAPIVLPVLFGGGDHMEVDLSARSGPDTTFLRPPGELSELPAILASLLRLAPGRQMRVGTRASRLAVAQARLAIDRLEQLGLETQLVPIESRGDRDLARSIGETGLFTDDLETALAHDEIDIAVHSLKDLPVDRPIAAMLPRGRVADVLVSADGMTLRTLPPGATVATSSRRRAYQILAQRPDLRTAPIRGAVESRIEQVRRGRFDAAVLAAAGLDRLERTVDIDDVFDPATFLPAPGQGAIALQVRPEDTASRAAAHLIGCPGTEHTAGAEREFERRATEEEADLTCAARAVVRGGRVRLQGAIWNGTGALQWEGCVETERPVDAPRCAARAGGAA